MYAKIILSVLVVFGCGYAGVLFGRAGNMRVSQLDSLINALKALELSVSYTGAKLSDALSEIYCSDSVIESMFAKTADYLRRDKGLSVKSAWSMAERESKTGLYLKDEDISVMNGFICSLGGGDRENELKNIRAALARLGVLHGEARESAAKGARLYKNCGFLIGAMAALILF